MKARGAGGLDADIASRTIGADKGRAHPRLRRIAGGGRMMTGSPPSSRNVSGRLYGVSGPQKYFVSPWFVLGSVAGTGGERQGCHLSREVVGASSNR